MMKPARRRARTLLPTAMPAMVGAGRGCGWVEAEAVDELAWVVVGAGTGLAVVVKVITSCGWDVRVMVEVTVVVASALRTLRNVSMSIV